jgi:signal transduction histidine kinase
MSSRERSEERSARPGETRFPGGDRFERFRYLSHELLTNAAKGLLRKDFLPMVSERIMEFSGADATELWVKEDPSKHFRCSVTASRKMPFGFILVPCPLGEEVGPPPAGGGGPGLERLCCNVINGTLGDSNPRATANGSYWSGDSPEFYGSLALVPVRLEEECVGLLQLKSTRNDFFSADDLAFWEDIAAMLGIAFSYQFARAELGERIKELTCLFGIARVAAQPELSIDEALQKIVDLLPPAWLFPEIACARIVLADRSYTTEGFRSSPYRQSSDVIVNREKVGVVEVFYLERRLTLDEGPFLAEERSLIENVGREVASLYERTQAEQERTLLHDQLRHADRLATIGQLAAGVAHEINEPLGNILGFAQLARKGAELPEQTQKDLRSIESAVLHAREIIKKLLVFARQLPPKKVVMNVNDLVNDGLQFLESRCAKAGIRVLRRLDENIPAVIADPDQMNQVLVNLVVNAIQAMPEGGTLTIETYGADGGLCFSVADTGIGISEELKKQIFLPFFSTKEINEGTGLGLAVVHGIVTSHKGRITVETKETKGSRFVVYIPLGDAPLP